jgi:hypothetical protein
VYTDTTVLKVRKLVAALAAYYFKEEIMIEWLVIGIIISVGAAFLIEYVRTRTRGE